MAIHVDPTQIRAFADQLRGAPKELQATLRRAITEAATELLADIKANSSWSSRIPGATKMRVGFGERNAGVLVYVDSRQAPHARPFEGAQRRGDGTFRHPVFGNPDNWVSQPTRPYFMPAIRANEAKTVSRVQDAINQVFNRL